MLNAKRLRHYDTQYAYIYIYNICVHCILCRVSEKDHTHTHIDTHRHRKRDEHRSFICDMSDMDELFTYECYITYEDIHM